MGQMAYGGDHAVMLPIVQDQSCPHRQRHQRGIPFRLFPDIRVG